MINKTIINDLMEELLTHKDCVFRGENKYHDNVSSKLYQQYFEDGSVINSENFSVLTIEENIVSQAKNHISNTASNIEVLTELQHYGGKTALIDFTHNVLVALFFACDGEFKKDGRIIVFKRSDAVEQNDIDYKKPQDYGLISPTGKSPRVIFQSSVFIHSQQGLIEAGKYKIVTIEKTHKKALLKYLKQFFDIETATIYNDIHGFIQNQDNYSTTELEFYRGMACQENEDFTQAIKYYTKAIELNSQSAEAYNNRGNAKAALGKHKEAIADYDQAIKLNPQSAEIYNNRGTAKYYLGKYQEAIADYDQAIVLNPQFAEAYNNRGIAKTALGKHKEAIADYDKAIVLNPKYAEAYYNRGNAKFALGDKKAAIEDYGHAIALNPQFAEAYNNRGIAKFALGDKKAAIADYDKAIVLNPEYAEAYYNRGTVKAALGEHEAAIADYDQAIALNPKYAEAYYNRGVAKFDLDKHQEARIDFNQAKKLFKQQGNTKLIAKVEQAIEELNQAIKNDK